MARLPTAGILSLLMKLNLRSFQIASFLKDVSNANVKKEALGWLDS